MKDKATMEPQNSVRDFPKHLFQNKLQRLISFKIIKGKILGLGGRSVYGKMTIGRLLLRLIEPTETSTLFRTSHEVRRVNGPTKLQGTPYKRYKKLCYNFL